MRILAVMALVMKCILLAVLFVIVPRNLWGDPKRTETIAPEGEWKHRKSMQEGASFAGTVGMADGHIYVLTGLTGNPEHLSTSNRVYDTLTDSWSTLAPIPTPRSEPGAALGPDGKIYVIGGDPFHRKNPSKMNVVEAYDPRTDKWETRKPLPTPRTSLCAVTARAADGNMRIYAIAGRNYDMPGNGLNTVEAYDPLLDRWTTMAPLPINLHAITATLGPDGKVYVLGGTNSEVSETNAMQIYDPQTDRWVQGTPMPYGQECASSTFTPGPNGEIVILGGWGDPRKIELDSVVAYNPRIGAWRFLPPLLKGAAAAGAVTMQSASGYTRIYMIGGTPHLTGVQQYSFRSP